jgi:hypothetical protein
MINNQMIIDEVNRLIVEKYPNTPVYIDKVPDGFARPSFFIEFVIDNSDTVNKNTTFENLFLNVIYFGTEDEYGITNSIEKQEVLNELKAIFRQGFVEVDERAISVKVRSKVVDDEVALEMTFEYYEQRTDVLIDVELMQELEINQNVN